jgi:hypothetical protein
MAPIAGDPLPHGRSEPSAIALQKPFARCRYGTCRRAVTTRIAEPATAVVPAPQFGSFEGSTNG